jgi:hypothetical protein
MRSSHCACLNLVVLLDSTIQSNGVFWSKAKWLMRCACLNLVVLLDMHCHSMFRFSPVSNLIKWNTI